jgi:cytochrome c-type biogenesis protein CcmH/NrfF
MIRRIAALTLLLGVVGAPSALAAAASLPAIERQVMCVTCKIPLEVADSPQANSEREYIRALIAKGHGEEQIKQELVDQYGPAVLALPQDSGFNLAVYLVPALVVVAGVILLAVLLPRWRRRAPATAAGPQLSVEQRARIDEDMAQSE